MEFSTEQLESLLHWLEYLAENGMTIEQVIEGLINGTLTLALSNSSTSIPK